MGCKLFIPFSNLTIKKILIYWGTVPVFINFQNRLLLGNQNIGGGYKSEDSVLGRQGNIKGYISINCDTS